MKKDRNSRMVTIAQFVGSPYLAYTKINDRRDWQIMLQKMTVRREAGSRFVDMDLWFLAYGPQHRSSDIPNVQPMHAASEQTVIDKIFANDFPEHDTDGIHWNNQSHSGTGFRVGLKSGMSFGKTVIVLAEWIHRIFPEGVNSTACWIRKLAIHEDKEHYFRGDWKGQPGWLSYADKLLFDHGKITADEARLRLVS